tara:strand:+ start:5408 stop:6067 length:660 start_codon:yes stop_codon:yes gene_type:complete
VNRIIIISITFFLFTTILVAKEKAYVIEWGNLVPTMQVLEDPFKHLTEEQLYDLESIDYFRDAYDQKGPINSEDSEEVLRLVNNLKSANLDVNALLLTYDEYLKEIERRSWLVVNELNGRFIRLAGYILPLEFNESGVDEFFLVPYIGACIHVPPPPPNQIVYIRTKEKLMVEELYRPVWVTGHLNIEASSRSLFLVDGSDDIPFGYIIENAVIEDYNE